MKKDDATQLLLNTIQLKSNYAVLEIIENLITIPENTDIENVEMPPVCQEIFDCVKEDFYNLRDIVEGGLNSDKKYFNKYENYKKQIVDMAISTLLYEQTIELSKTHFFMSEVSKEFEVDKNYSVDIGTLIKDLLDYVYGPEEEDPVGSLIRCGEIFSTIPARMTKDKFKEVVSDSFKLMETEESYEELCGRIRRMEIATMPDSQKEYGTYFPHMKSRIEQLNKKTYEDINEEDASAIAEEFFDIERDIYALTNYLENLYCMLNSMQILVEYINSTDLIFDNDLILKDIYYTSKSFVLGNESDPFLYAEFFNAMSDKAVYNLEALGTAEDFSNNQFENALEDRNLVNMLEFSMSLSQLMFPYLREIALYELTVANLGTCTREKYETMLDTFFTSFFEDLQNADSNLKRIKKATLLGTIIFPYTEAELMEFVRNYFDSADTLKSKALVLEELKEILENTL